MKREPMIGGQIDLLLLSVVGRRPAHGYAIIEALRLRSGGRIDLAEGTIYPALYRLEHAGYLESASETVSGRSRRIYRLTRSGRAALRERRQAWREVVAGIHAIVHVDPASEHG